MMARRGGEGGGCMRVSHQFACIGKRKVILPSVSSPAAFFISSSTMGISPREFLISFIRLWMSSTEVQYSPSIHRAARWILAGESQQEDKRKQGNQKMITTGVLMIHAWVRYNNLHWINTVRHLQNRGGEGGWGARMPKGGNCCNFSNLATNYINPQKAPVCKEH